jgi:hypothetical protein
MNCHCQIVDLELSVELDQKVISLEISDDNTHQMEIESPIVIQQVDDSEKYEGEYTITPKFTEQILETKNKFLKDDIDVEAISVSRVTNLSGGTTVYIGGIFNG